MAKIAGRFYFKRTSNGNLVGEWSNNAESRAFSESADLKESVDGQYLGVFDSTWLENQTPILARLTITRKQKSTSLFTLQWRGQSNFDGEGMLCDDILIGDYHSL